MSEMYKSLNREFGDILKFPNMFGKPGMLCVFKPEDIEKVFRNEEVQHPYRRAIETLTYYRNILRPDIYQEFGSVFTDQGERWYKTRKILNPIMMKPQTVKQYIPAVDEISKEFIQK
jgi:cytochrome P450 family 12